MKKLDWDKIKKHQRVQKGFCRKAQRVVDHIRALAKEGKVENVSIKNHVIERLNERGIHMMAVQQILETGDIIEYQGSHLNDNKKRIQLKNNEKTKGSFNTDVVNVILGGTVDGKPIHVCVNIINMNEIHIKTVYDPSQEDAWKWVKGKDFKVRAFYIK